MQVVIRSFFGQGSGVLPDLIGKSAHTLVCDDDEELLIISELLSCVAQKQDIHLQFIED